MITGRQIRAARGLLKWSAVNLAEKSGLTRETINKIEDDLVQPREGTVADIIRVFSENGVEFLDNDGVKLRPQSIEIFEGRERFDEFYELIYETVKRDGGDMCIAGCSTKLFSKYRKDPQLHRKRMAELYSEHKIAVRTLIEEGDTYMPNTSFTKYRWQKKEYFPPTAFYVFGPCVALISFENITPPYVILIKSALFAEAYRRSFNNAWESAEEPPPQNPTE